MIHIDDLIRAIKTFRPEPDDEQKKVIKPSPADPLFIVAGPGTGKTTCLTFRILKLVLVDGVPPKGIIATTFTKKAAEELRSRVLGWGFRVIDALASDPQLKSAQKDAVAKVDVNQVWTGTIDSLCEEVLRRHRAPGTQPPMLVDDFVSKTLLLREGLFGQSRHKDNDLEAMLLRLHNAASNRFGFHIGTKAELLQTLWERRFQDQVQWNDFVQKAPAGEKTGRHRADEALADYDAALKQRGMVDFALLEHEVLVRLRGGQLQDFTKDLLVLLVDEYQDSNLLQEQIYFELAGACKGALCIVGDDDQSLYRFRGATVDLFRDFPTRYKARFGVTPQPIFLTNNYRSTKSIIDLVNVYARLDAGYQAVRVANKPKLSHAPKAAQGVPILGIFRPTPDDLARDLAQFIHQVFRGAGVTVHGHRIIRDQAGGDVGDCALLCSSPAEYAASFGNAPPRERLPLLLRRELGRLRPRLQVFNPRGEDLAGIPLVQRFGGLLAECIDPGAVAQGNTSGLSQDVIGALNDWRNTAIAFVNDPKAPKGLLDYATGWVDRDPKRKGLVWPRSVSVIDLVYGLVHYFPELHDDPEGQVYLEVFTRQLAACEQLGKFGAKLVHDPKDPGLGEASVKELLRDFLGPVAGGIVGVNEELLETFPRDRLSILSIHQSKGLEFPLTIVDVGSDFRSDHRAHAFKRFPQEGGAPHRMEDLVRKHSSLGSPSRSQVDRAFDDLYRQFFVAFSRPQDVLLLVGLSRSAPTGDIANVASGWARTGQAHWGGKTCPITMI